MRLQSVFSKCMKFANDLLPRIVEEEVAMIYKGNRLIPVCCLHEWEMGVSLPDAICRYRMIRWMGTDWSVSRSDIPYEPERDRNYVKEIKGKT